MTAPAPATSTMTGALGAAAMTRRASPNAEDAPRGRLARVGCAGCVASRSSPGSEGRRIHGARLVGLDGMLSPGWPPIAGGLAPAMRRGDRVQITEETNEYAGCHGELIDFTVAGDPIVAVEVKTVATWNVAFKPH